MAKPTSDLDWATAGTKTEPTSGQKAAGFDLGDYPNPEKVNYRWDAQTQLIDWLDEVRPKPYDDMRAAIDATSPMDLVSWSSDQDWVDGDVTKSTSGTVIHLCTDGRRVYYIVGTVLYAATADAVTTAQVEWSVDFSATIGTTVNHLSTDGAIVAAFSATGAKMVVYNAVTGAFIGSFNTGVLSPSGDPGVICDTDSNDYRVWIGNDIAGTAPLSVWTLAGGLVALPFTGADVCKFAAMTKSSILLIDDTNVRYIDKANSGGLISSDTIQNQNGVIWAFGRDDLFCYGGLITPSAAISLGGVNTETNQTSSNTLNDAGPGVWGDGMFFTKEHAINWDGDVLHVFDPVATGDIALAGQYLWAIISGALVARPIKMKKHDLWLRQSDGSDGNFNGRSSAGARLMTKLEW
jgi:hypothetical protein